MFRRLSLFVIPLFVLLLLAPTAEAADTTTRPPVLSDVDRARADRVRAIDGTTAMGRFSQLLAARELDDSALFALAETHPGIVEQVKLSKYRNAMAYLAQLPPPVLHRLRNGETVIRDELKGRERDTAVALGSELGLRKANKLTAVRVGPLEGRSYRLEVVGKKGTVDLELGWPSTPQRDDASRDELAKIFGARPTRPSSWGNRLVLQNGSFEDAAEVAPPWHLEQGVVLGSTSPIGAVVIDSDVSIDGTRSLRFYADVKTRVFPVAVQRLPVQAGMRLKATAQVKADNLRPEYQQRPGDVFLALSFEDAAGRTLGEAVWARGNMASHPWQALVVNAETPPDATQVRIAVGSALSGTAWFDGVTLEQVQ